MSEVQEKKFVKRAKPIDDLTFITICERVARSENPTVDAIVEEIAKVTPDGEKVMSRQTVSQKRATINATYGKGTLTELPRGTSTKTKNVAEMLEKIKALKASLDTPEDEIDSDELVDEESENVDDQ